MNTPQFLINDLLEEHKKNYPDNLPENITKLKKTLYEKGILSKEYLEDNLMLLYHKYDSPITSELERECRSLVIDLTNLKIKSYSCESPRLNKEGIEFLLANSNEKQIITTCYEGTLLSLFHHNNKWYNSTRRCLDSNKSIFTNGDKQSLTNCNDSHFSMFEEILKNAGYDNFDDFCSRLDTTKSYYFVLIHHKNKHIIDYSSQFGENYGRACLTSIRDKNMYELDIYNNQDIIILNEQNVLFVHDKYESVESFYELNKKYNYDFTVVPNSEGIIIRIWSSKLQKYNLIKLQYTNYQIAQVVGPDQNIFKGILYLYQLNKLVDYFANNTHSNFNKMINPNNTSESYDTVGIVDAVFKVCTSELFVLFKMLWSLKNGQQQNKYLYDILPKEYKVILFEIKGLYYKKKSDNFNNNNKKLSHLNLGDIYNYLKKLPIEQLIAFIRMRKLMFNWASNSSNEKLDTLTKQALKDFNTISLFCNKVHIKLCTIFTHKLYPNIMPTDIPFESVKII
jgi:hypothetical protein